MADLSAVKEFQEQVKNLYEAEYGDFKRKIGLYLRRLEQGLPEPLSADSKQKLQEIKQAVVYSPRTTDIEEARQMTLEMAEKLR